MASTPTKKRLHQAKRQTSRKRPIQRVGDMTVDEFQEMIQTVFEHQIIALPDKSAWQKERVFIQALINQGPIPGKRKWTREELYDR